MKPFHKSGKARQPVAKDVLISLARKLAESNSRLEMQWWQARLGENISTLLEEGREDVLNEALDILSTEPSSQDSPAQDMLAEAIEFAIETRSLEIDGQPHIALLVATPILAWSRYAVPSGPLPKRLLNTLKKHLQTDVLASQAKLSLADYLFSPDQLPRTYNDTRRLLIGFCKQAIQGTPLTIDRADLPETNRFLADVRYALGCIIVPSGQAIFSWQENNLPTETVLADWQKNVRPLLEPLFTGCACKLLLPNAYHAACRDADRAVRPYAIEACVAFLHATLGLSAAELSATIAPCYDKEHLEYRVAFAPIGQETPFQGMVWPSLGEDEFSEDAETVTEIEAAIRAHGISDIVFLNQRFPAEFCDDCGAPLYPNREGELVHLEMHESGQAANLTLH